MVVVLIFRGLISSHHAEKRHAFSHYMFALRSVRKGVSFINVFAIHDDSLLLIEEKGY
jgi:hypothetical protein